MSDEAIRLMTDNRIRRIKEIAADRPGPHWSDRTVLGLIARLEAAEAQVKSE